MDECQTAHTDCVELPPTTTLPPGPPCFGEIIYHCNLANEWEYKSGSCCPCGTSFSDCNCCDCIANFPTVACDCGDVTAMPCYDDTTLCPTTTLDPCRTTVSTTATTTVTTTLPCDGECRFVWVALISQWVKTDSSGCGGCLCFEPSYDGLADGETSNGRCVTSTTTTTLGPCCDGAYPCPADPAAGDLLTLTVTVIDTNEFIPGTTIPKTKDLVIQLHTVTGPGEATQVCEWDSDFLANADSCGQDGNYWQLVHVHNTTQDYYRLSLIGRDSITDPPTALAIYYLDAGCALPATLASVYDAGVCIPVGGAVIDCPPATTTTVTTTLAPSACAFCADGTYPGATLELGMDVGDNACPHCTEASGLFTLNVTGDPCIWMTDPVSVTPDVLCESTTSWRYRLTSFNGYWYLELLRSDDSTVLTWIQAKTGNDCTMPLSLTFNGGNVSQCVSNADAVVS